jgi:sugar phosphate isomerase/epimerase
MKVGIDSYCYHRYFGEVYDHQEKPSQTWALEDFINRAKELKVDGVSLESCFVRLDRAYLSEIKDMLDEAGLERVWAWGHPDGLEGGKNEPEFDKMLENFEYAKAIGAPIMRVVGSSLMFRNEPHQAQIERLSAMFQKAVKTAERYDVKMAIENHIDFNSDEILQLLTNVGSSYFGVNFDTGNFIRVLDDPVKAAEKLGKHVLATHVKDVRLLDSVPADTWYFFSSAPIGQGLVDVKGVAGALKNCGYEGVLALEIDSLHPDYAGQEDKVVEDSISRLRALTSDL